MNINLQLGIDTKVDAINAVLNAIGETGIGAEDEIDYNVDASSAAMLIDNISQKIQIYQGKGWWFNREEFHKFDPDPISGVVSLPNNTLACFIKRERGAVKPVTMRGTKLFDSKEMGYDMRSATMRDGKLHCIVVVALEFDALPATAKHAITDAACYWIVNNLEGDQIKLKSYKDASDQSFIALQGEDSSQLRRNVFDSGFIRGRVAMAGGYNNNM